MIEILSDWNFEMTEDSVKATVFQFTLGEIQASLFHAYEKDLKARILYTESRVEFAEFTMTFLKSVAEKGAESKYQFLCREAYQEYTGPNICAYNIARSFVKVKQFLSENVSPRVENWKWGRVHFNQYDSLPWSKTPLRYIF